MATISTLAIRVAMNASAVTPATAAIVNNVSRIATQVSSAGKLIQATESGTAKALEATGQAYQKVTDYAKSYLKTILGVSAAGAGAAMVANSVKTFAAAQDRSKELSETEKLSSHYEQLNRSVGLANETFGESFARSARLTETMRQVNSAVQRLTPFFSMLGSVVGTTFNYLVNYTPVLMLLMAAFKALSVVLGIVTSAVGFLAQVIAFRLLTQFVTYYAFGGRMTPMTLAWAAAQYVLNAALTAGAIALKLLAVVGVPVWGLIAAAAGMAAVAIGAVAAATWGLVKAWQWLTSAKPIKHETVEQIKKAANTLKEAQDAAEGMRNALQLQIDQHGMSESQKMLDDYIRARKAVEAAGGGDQSALIEEYKKQLAIRDVLIQQASIAETIARLRQEATAAGFSNTEQTMQALAAQGATQEQLNVAKSLMDYTQQRAQEAERVKSLETEIASIARTSAQVGMSETQRRLAALQELGADAQQLAAAEASLNAAAEQERFLDQQKKLSEEIARIQQDAAMAGLSETERRLAMLRQIGASEEQILAARRDLQMVEAAAEQKKYEDDIANRATRLIDEVATPMDELEKKIAGILELRELGAIGDRHARLAIAEAKQEARQALRDNANSRGSSSSPKALLRGSAEAALAENRQQNGFDRLAEINRQQIARQDRIIDLARQQLAAIKENDFQVVSLN